MEEQGGWKCGSAELLVEHVADLTALAVILLETKERIWAYLLVGDEFPLLSVPACLSGNMIGSCVCGRILMTSGTTGLGGPWLVFT